MIKSNFLTKGGILAIAIVAFGLQAPSAKAVVVHTPVNIWLVDDFDPDSGNRNDPYDGPLVCTAGDPGSCLSKGGSTGTAEPQNLPVPILDNGEIVGWTIGNETSDNITTFNSPALAKYNVPSGPGAQNPEDGSWEYEYGDSSNWMISGAGVSAGDEPDDWGTWTFKMTNDYAGPLPHYVVSKSGLTWLIQEFVVGELNVGDMYMGYWYSNLYNGNTDLSHLSFYNTSPIPIPAPLALFLTGLAGLGILARRRKKSA